MQHQTPNIADILLSPVLDADRSLNNHLSDLGLTTARSEHAFCKRIFDGSHLLGEFDLIEAWRLVCDRRSTRVAA